MATPVEEKAGMEAINKLKSTDPPLFLSPNADLSLSARIASQYLFITLKPYSPKSPFDQLLTDGFDAEQIWQQIDLQSQPLISSLKREIKRFEKNPDEISKGFGKGEVNGGLKRDLKVNGDVGMGDSDEDEDEDEDEDVEMVNGEDEEEEEDEDDGDESEEDEDDEEISDGEGVPEVEDDFLKIKELEKYLMREEEREYGSDEKLNKKKKKKGANKAPRKGANEDEDEDEDEEDASEGGEDDDELLMYRGGDEDGSDEDIRYEDFFARDTKKPKTKRKQVDKSDDSEMEDVFARDTKKPKTKRKQVDKSDDSEMEDEGDKQKEENLSTHEKERLKIQAKIEEMEKANLDAKEWTMQGEVTAAKRPKDSALEVDLDFEHSMRPPPVITEEVTESLEEIIKKRILEENFDDVERAPKLPSTAPKKTMELDDNKSKKGLAEVYEDDFAQQTGLASAPVSFNDELKKEASKVFKGLCLKLDALSHFHFAPKPVVEDMSVQANVPALAMEEIAPMAVSDAAMLAPEEVFAGKGDVKEETELSKEDRKRRRAKKKRKSKAINATRIIKRQSVKPSQTATEGKEK